MLKQMRTYEIREIEDVEAVKLRFDTGLGEGWEQEVNVTEAQNLNLEKAWAFYKKRAKKEKNLPGSMVNKSSLKKNAVHNLTEVKELAGLVAKLQQLCSSGKGGGKGGVVHTTTTQPDICRDFQHGKCKRGDSCRYRHLTGAQATPAAATGDESGVKCFH